MIITIDGPSASGKSSVARDVAHELHIFYIASGYFFRGLAYALMHTRSYNQDTIPNASQKDIAYCLDPVRFDYMYDVADGEHIIINGIDCTKELKTPVIDKGASLLGTNIVARSHIVTYIRSLAQRHDIVIDGRDCGSVMFPHAQYKIFLTASVEVRAQRWQAMQLKSNILIDVAKAMEIISERDARDSTRVIAPLIIPDGAIFIDSSHLDQKQVLDLILKYVHAQKEGEA